MASIINRQNGGLPAFTNDQEGVIRAMAMLNHLTPPEEHMKSLLAEKEAAQRQANAEDRAEADPKTSVAAAACALRSETINTRISKAPLRASRR